MEFNSALDNYFAQIIFKDILNLRKTFLSRILKDEIKKLNSLLKKSKAKTSQVRKLKFKAVTLWLQKRGKRVSKKHMNISFIFGF